MHDNTYFVDVHFFGLLRTCNINGTFIKIFLIDIKDYTSADLEVLIFSMLLVIEKFKFKFLYLRLV
jgi:hypothetical protein